jgi:hypothetical protein
MGLVNQIAKEVLAQANQVNGAQEIRSMLSF